MNAAYTKYELVRLVRNKRAFIFSLIFPLALFLLIVVQHTQSHANRATQLKLDELIRASDRASNRMITVEDASGSDLDRIHAEFSEKVQHE